MGARNHLILSFAAVAALAALFVQHRCGTPVPVAVRELWMNRDVWTGKDVEVVGELKAFSPGTADAHSAIEDDGFRVGVRGDARPAPNTLLGHRVRARGVFVFTEKFGGYLESPSLSQAD